MSQSRIEQFGSFVVSSSKQIIESAMKNFFISRKAFFSVGCGGLVEVTLTLHEELQKLVNGCGHGRLLDANLF